MSLIVTAAVSVLASGPVQAQASGFLVVFDREGEPVPWTEIRDQSPRLLGVQEDCAPCEKALFELRDLSDLAVVYWGSSKNFRQWTRSQASNLKIYRGHPKDRPVEVEATPVAWIQGKRVPIKELRSKGTP